MKLVIVVASMVVVLFYAGSSSFISQPQQAAGTASVEGIVVRAGTGEPIQGARVTLLFVPPPAPRGQGGGVSVIADRFLASGLPPTITHSAPAAALASGGVFPVSSIPSVTSDSNGVFVFRNLQAGSYRLAVAGNGYVPQEYGPTNRIVSAAAAPLALSSGQALTGITFRLTPTGNISGRVLDLNGQPLPGAPVNLYRAAYNPTGEWNPTVVATVRANDRGEYRIFWIAPGRHYVVAGGNAATGRPIASINNDVLDNFGYAFCPQGSDIDNASSVDVKPGSELICDFRLERQSFYRISGRVVDSRTGQPPVGGSVSIASRSPIGARGTGAGRVFYDPSNGTFEAVDVPPGIYNLTSMTNERPPVATGPVPLGAFSASSIVRVASADVRDVLLTITAGASVSGNVAADSPIPPGSRLQVRLVPTSAAIGAQQVTTQVNPDGSFTFQPGSFRFGLAEYRVTMTNVIGQSGLPVGWYLKEARLGETDIMNRAVRLPAEASLNLALSSKGGQVTGVVRNDRQQPVPGNYVVMVPDGMPERAELFHVAIADPAGRFNLPNIPPGNYKLFTWERAEPGVWFDPAFLKDFEAKGTSFRVDEGTRGTIDLTAIPAGGAQ